MVTIIATWIPGFILAWSLGFRCFCTRSTKRVARWLKVLEGRLLHTERGVRQRVGLAVEERCHRRVDPNAIGMHWGLWAIRRCCAGKREGLLQLAMH